MISDYLYRLYLNAPVFKENKKNEDALKKYFEAEVLKSIRFLNLQNENQLIDFLITNDLSKLKDFFSQHPFIEIFYLVNSLSEYSKGQNCFDELGRLKFENSIQYQNGITKNIVLEKMLESQKKDLILNYALSVKNHPSYFFLSHDIDSIHGSLTQDGLWALKHGRIDYIFKLLFNAAIQKPEWFNMDKIMKTESEYGFKSTFYWLVNKGKIDERQSNADYDINHKKVRNTLKSIEQNGYENGIHKSISRDSFETEIKKLNNTVTGNRYHYLKFNLPAAYEEINLSGLKSDASLGFAEHYGFRNNYGYPFHPYNLNTGKPYSFLEIPLNVMDGTFQRYMKVPVKETANTITRFLENHKTNSLISVLWHNTFFSNYKYHGYFNEYKKILHYLYENKFTCLNQTEIQNTFTWKK